ncbi:glycosyltransferase family 2 protein [Paenarthrobacter histidinolovorans]|uniref:glycosyltransferase family 2 protein n=1 Tax=Paenarthrobacter histidinolovorans TaxID=43664 RepID=UPI001E2B554E|nr:glycosyltransferase [Paenarthrobacter histidinolovorans]
MNVVTVVIPAYNSQDTIRRAIDSCRDIERCRILVVDDGSTDATATVARDAGAEVIAQSNAGASHARRNGISHSSTDFIALLDADDELIPDGVTESVRMLQSDPDLCVVGGRVIGVDPNGREHLLERHYRAVSTEDLLLTGFGPWPPAAAVMRRSAFDRAARLSIPSLDTRYAEDYEMIIRLSMVGRVGMHDQPATRYRLYAGKSSHAPTRAIADKEAIRKHYASATGIRANLMSFQEIKGAAYTRAARTAWANGRKTSAVTWILRSIMVAPKILPGKLLKRISRPAPSRE